MSRVRPKPFLIVLALTSIASAGLAVAQPHAAACAALGAMPLERLPDGSYADSGLSVADRRAVVKQHEAALQRIAATFGIARAQPIVVHLSTSDALRPVSYNSFGSTDFLPGRTCIVLGPDGRNVDVFAHELVHAEIADRLGFWTRWRQLPVWFDEGAAMQVDYRSAFNPRGPVSNADRRGVRMKISSASFFAVSPDQLTVHYATAKQVMADWLSQTGKRAFYGHLSAMQQGEPFHKVWAG